MTHGKAIKNKLSLAQKSFLKRKKTMSLNVREYKHGKSTNGKKEKRMLSYKQHGGGESRN